MNGTSSIVKLDVGGTVFHTTRSTLNAHSYFSRLLDQATRTSHVFIDRDPTHFRYILNYMRGSGTIPDRTQDVAELWVEADFYSLSDYATQLDTVGQARREPIDRMVGAIEELRREMTYLR